MQNEDTIFAFYWHIERFFKELLVKFLPLILGGMAGLMVCLFAKFKGWKDERSRKGVHELNQQPQGVEQPEEIRPE